LIGADFAKLGAIVGLVERVTFGFQRAEFQFEIVQINRKNTCRVCIFFKHRNDAGVVKNRSQLRASFFFLVTGVRPRNADINLGGP